MTVGFNLMIFPRQLTRSPCHSLRARVKKPLLIAKKTLILYLLELSNLVDFEIDYENLEIQEQIGQGNFGIVLKVIFFNTVCIDSLTPSMQQAIWKGETVVVKKMLQSLTEKQLLEFKSELSILM